MWLVFCVLACKNAEPVPQAMGEIYGYWNFMGYAKADNIGINQSMAVHPYASFLEFEADGKVNGRAAVNLIYASYEKLDRTDDYRGNDLKINGGLSTKIAVTPTQATFEDKFVQHLAQVSSYRVFDSEVLVLYLKYPNPTESLIFRKQVK